MSKKIFFWVFAVLFFVALNKFAYAQQFIHDDANLLTNDDVLESVAQEINNYNNYGANVVVYTVNDDLEFQNLIDAQFSKDSLDVTFRGIINLNILVIYKEGFEYPALVFADNCGLDKEEMSFVLNNEYIQEDDLPVNSDMFVQVSDPDGQVSYTLGWGALTSSKEYDTAFLRLLNFLGGEIKDAINPNRISMKYKYCSFSGQDIVDDTSSDKNPEPLEIPSIILSRLKQIEPFVDQATKKYPRVNKNLELAKIAAESGGVVRAVSVLLPDGSRAGDYGLTQINPCTAKDLGLIKHLSCAAWISGSPKNNPCDPKQCQLRKISLTQDLENILDARKNILAGTKYLNSKILTCQFISDKYDRIRCGVASYNAGYTHVRRAIAKADSTQFVDYYNRLPNPKITGPYVDKIIGYMVWLEQNPDAVSQAT